jgi:hypothetical protein
LLDDMRARCPAFAEALGAHLLRLIEQHEAVDLWKHGAGGGFVHRLDIALRSVRLRWIGPLERISPQLNWCSPEQRSGRLYACNRAAKGG